MKYSDFQKQNVLQKFITIKLKKNNYKVENFFLKKSIEW